MRWFLLTGSSGGVKRDMYLWTSWPDFVWVDQTFVLSELIRSRRKKGLKTYCAFLDIKKAYDKIFRDGLWKRLIEIGITGKIWRILHILYMVVESCVLVG